ncbi:MAG: FtsQ-type POTRA domain-containing protein [Chloroflexota bacterium]|nr:FtsQ-type POTRA domain-containing protein [Chloroflexota bacterium]
MSPQQRPYRRAAPRHTHRRLHSTATVDRKGFELSGLLNGLSTQRQKVAASVLMLLVLAVLFEFFNGDWFYVYALDVNGIQYLSQGEVERASGVIGYNIFFVDAHAVERALAKLPEVKSVRVTTGLPQRVTVSVEERAPDVIWLRGAEAYWVDAEGIVFRARANLTTLPSIRDLDQVTVKPGQPVAPDAFAASRALRAVWPDAPRAFEWSTARGLAYTDEHGWKIYLGDASEMAGKLATLRALVPQLLSQNAKIKFIDLSKGDPFYQ